MSRRPWAALIWLGSVAPGVLVLAIGTPAQEQPLDVGLQEQAGVTLVILDIDAVDRHGRPIPGLTAADFELYLGASPWEIYAVDDFCPCQESSTASSDRSERLADVKGPAAESPRPSGDRGAGTAAGPPDDVIAPGDIRTKFILYFDFSQLQPDGRDRSLDAARRWLGGSLREGDQVQIVAYLDRGGLQELIPFTDDRQRLLAVVNRIEPDMDYVESFPMAFSQRAADCDICIRDCLRSAPCPEPPGCDSCCEPCVTGAWEEYQHSQRSLRALRQYLARLESVPGRKALMLFHQNMTVFPARFYLGPPRDADFEVGTNQRLLDEVGAQATASRTRVHVLAASANRGFRQAARPLADMAANLGANLADFTGGTYAQASRDLQRLMDAAVQACACSYRISFKPPHPDRSEVYNARVFIKKRRLPFSYRVQHLEPEERIYRKAQAVLDHPESYSEIPASLAFMPVRRAARGWDMRATIGLPLAALEAPGAVGDIRLHLDASAVLYPLFRHGGGKAVELLSGSRMRLPAGAAGRAWLVHEHDFKALHPGRYRLTGLLRDREGDRYGAGDAVLDLPGKGDRALVGPFLVCPDRSLYRADLPPRRGNEQPEPGTLTLERGDLAAGAGPVPRGEPVRLLTWACGGAAGDEGALPSRLVLRDGGQVDVLARRPETTTEEDCLRLEDRLDTRRLEPGSYTYLVKWPEPSQNSPATPASTALVDFEISQAEQGPLADVEQMPLPD